MLKVFALLFALVFASGEALQGQAPPELTDVRFFLSYIPNIQFAPVYVAMAKGYFAEEGYNLIVEHGEETIGVEQIALNNIPFGIVGGEQVILARSNERPIVYVYSWFQEYPIAIVIPSTTPASTVTDLAGRKVGVPGRFGATYSGLTAVLAANEMTELDIQLEAIGFNAPDVICMGAVEAAAVYINNEPLQIQHRAEAGDCGEVTGVTVIPVAEVANLVSNGVVTNEDTIASNPEQVAAINRAFDRGLRDTINNPAEAYLLSLDYVENLPQSDELLIALEEASAAQGDFLSDRPEREDVIDSRAALFTNLSEQFSVEDLTQFEVLLATIDLWDADELGVIDPERWTLTQEMLLSMSAISDEIDLSAAYTDAFLPTAIVEP